jgi:hypothetical protein
MDIESDRAGRYRQLAAEARRASSHSAHDDHREAYANIAKSWANLADYVERERFETGQGPSAGESRPDPSFTR